MRQFIVDPVIQGEVAVGTEGTGSKLYLGRLAETGPVRKVWFSAAKEFVVLLNGKRGSGKSHTLGVILEGLATREDDSSIANHSSRRAVLLLDPMGNFWTTLYLAAQDGGSRAREQFTALQGWRCQPEPLNVSVWLPAGHKSVNHPSEVREFRIRISDLDAADLADLLGTNLVRDPQGAALSEAYEAVHESRGDGTYQLSDLAAYLEHLKDIGGGDHAEGTLRALIRSVRALERQDVFSGAGTPLTELLKPGLLSVLMLPLSVGPDLRRVVTRLLIRRILKEREEASQILQRLSIQTALPLAERERLQREVDTRVPRTVLALDEAQELLGEDGGEAKEALESFCLLGRNYGLSLLLATQRPTASALSTKVRSQVDLCLTHRLLTQEDIDISERNLLGTYPREVMLGHEALDYPQLVRALEAGQAVVSASHAAANGEPLQRIFVLQVRPRISVHGGEVP
jgi:DNA helicase HerA-like ATPase